MSTVLLEVIDLKKYFPVRGGWIFSSKERVHAVDGVSFFIKNGEVLGLVGESGSGKTTTGKCIIRLIEPTNGVILWKDRDILKLNKRELRKARMQMQMLFQDPYSSLNPVMTVEDVINEALEARGLTKRDEKKEKVIELLRKMELPLYFMYRYPHELSGGEKQRVGIARALAVNPKLIIADEPVAALDASVKAKILNLLRDLQSELGLTFLYISHDLNTVAYMCNRVAVMYAGKLLELAPLKELFSSPRHPYTEALLSANPIPDPTVKMKRIILKGEVPSLINPPSGCRFQPRCRYAKPICSKEEPKLVEVEEDHFVACHLKPI